MGVRGLPLPTRKAIPMSTKSPNQKVNLSDIRNDLVKRGKPKYENVVLRDDILSLDAIDLNDAFIWGEAKVNLNQVPEKIQAEKMKYRNRAETIAESVSVKIAIHWNSIGEMIISRKANA